MAFSSSPHIFANERAPGAGVTAVLGPTNTGKTHLAIERMLAHSSGVIGLPLRLLAREVYNKIVDRAGVDSVALITGEEKIKPPKARFWVSTGTRARLHRSHPASARPRRNAAAWRRHHAPDHRAAIARRQHRDTAAAVAA
jgi:hypothetical protein